MLAFQFGGLAEIIRLSTPPTHVVRSKSIVSVFYGFGDASGTGFGDALVLPTGIQYPIPVWCVGEQPCREIVKLLGIIQSHQLHGGTRSLHVLPSPDPVGKCSGIFGQFGNAHKGRGLFVY